MYRSYPCGILTEYSGNKFAVGEIPCDKHCESNCKGYHIGIFCRIFFVATLTCRKLSLHLGAVDLRAEFVHIHAIAFCVGFQTSDLGAGSFHRSVVILPAEVG